MFWHIRTDRSVRTARFPNDAEIRLVRDSTARVSFEFRGNASPSSLLSFLRRLLERHHGRTGRNDDVKFRLAWRERNAPSGSSIHSVPLSSSSSLVYYYLGLRHLSALFPSHQAPVYTRSGDKRAPPPSLAEMQSKLERLAPRNSLPPFSSLSFLGSILRGLFSLSLASASSTARLRDFHSIRSPHHQPTLRPPSPAAPFLLASRRTFSFRQGNPGNYLIAKLTPTFYPDPITRLSNSRLCLCRTPFLRTRPVGQPVRVLSVAALNNFAE